MKKISLKWKALGGFRYISQREVYGRPAFLIEKTLVGSYTERWTLWHGTPEGQRVFMGSDGIAGYDSKTSSFDTLKSAKEYAAEIAATYGADLV